MELPKLSEARRNIDRMKNIQRELERLSMDMERKIQDMTKLTEETNRYLGDVESDLRKVENK